MPSLAVLLTCHNRVQQTISCLDKLYAGISPESISVFLVDDGSSDGTGDTVRKRYPHVSVLYGGGDLFWNRGMHKAFGEALKAGYEFYLWLNDDTFLYPNAISTMLETHEQLARSGREKSIIVGSTRDSSTGNFTYGGYISGNKVINPLGLKLRAPGNEAQKCDTMCGNCVLIPSSVTDIVGNINPAYLHRWGDVDYGLRAKKAGCECWIAPGYMADCDANPTANLHRVHTLPFKRRLAELHSIKGLGKSDWLRFVRTHGGVLWPAAWVRPYVRLLSDTLR